MRTLVAAATGAGHTAIRVLTGAGLAVFLVAYAAVGLFLLPVVAAALGILALPRLLQRTAQRLAGVASGAGPALRSALVGWLSLGR